MGTFERQRLKRALVSVIVALAAAHSFHTTVTRDSSDKVVAAAARLAVQKVARASSKGGVGAKGLYRERVRRLCHSQRAQTVAGNIARSWHKTCKAVVKAKGSGVRG